MKAGRNMKRAMLAAVVALCVAAPAASAAPDGQWEGRFELPYNFAIHDVMLPTGKVLTWSYPFGKTPFNGETQAGTGVASVWNPSKGTGSDAFTNVSANLPGALNIWCSGQSLLPDGRVLITGGNGKYSEDLNHDGDTDDPGEWYHGLDTVAIFDPFAFDRGENPWTVLSERMSHGRWYPTQVLLPNGKTLIFSGLTEHGDHDNNPDVEVFDPSKPVGSQIDVIGTRGTAGAPPNGDAYPHVFVMPTGNVMLTGPRPQDSWLLPGSVVNPFTSLTGWIDMPDGALRFAGNAVLDPLSNNFAYAIGGSDGGGGADTSPLATVDHVHEGSVEHDEHDMNIGRAHQNTVIMPDGSMGVFGGGVGNDPAGMGQWQARPDQRQVELWDPVTKAWRLGPAAGEDRAYHSTALLLPDGRIFTGGDDANGGSSDGRDGRNSDQGQIYEPWYYDQPRPAFTRLPKGLDYGKSYEFDGAGIARIVMMAPAAVTHAVDMNQRRVELPIVDGKIQMTSNRNLLVPGWHMMFGLNAAGVPSMAAWVEIGKDLPAAPKPPPPPPPPDPPGPPVPPPPGGQQPPAVDPDTRPNRPFQPPIVNPENPAKKAKYGKWDLRREPLAEDCGNLDTPNNVFKTLRTKRGIDYYNVKQWRAGCKAAILLITDRKLRRYQSGKRTARGYKCSARTTVNRTVGKHVRTITCKASKQRVIAWQVKLQGGGK
jgi:hypothetical protein